MLKLNYCNSMTKEKFSKLEKLLHILDGHSVMIDFRTGIFNVLYTEEYFCGYTDDKSVYIGSVEYTPNIEKSNIIDMIYNQIENMINIEIALNDGSLIKIYN